MNGLMLFNNKEFGEIRTIEIDGEIYFVGKDVATALGYAKPHNAIVNHIDKEDTLKQGIMDKFVDDGYINFTNDTENN